MIIACFVITWQCQSFNRNKGFEGVGWLFWVGTLGSLLSLGVVFLTWSTEPFTWEGSSRAQPSCCIPHCCFEGVTSNSSHRPRAAPELQFENRSWPWHRPGVSLTSWAADNNIHVSWASGFQAGFCIWFYGRWQEECTALVHVFCALCSNVIFPSPFLYTTHSWMLYFIASMGFITRDFGVHQALSCLAVCLVWLDYILLE